MTFTNDQLREIERVNLILLKKIMAQRKPRTNGTVVVTQPQRKTSSAINRARSEKNIEKDNMVSYLGNIFCCSKSMIVETSFVRKMGKQSRMFINNR